MTRFNYKLFAVMLFLFCAPAMAINKCTGIDDKLVFQDMPANWGQIPIKHANSKVIIFFDDTPSIKSTGSNWGQIPILSIAELLSNGY